MSITEKMVTLAGAIRSRARAHNLVLAELTCNQINRLADAQYREQPNTAAAQFYGDEDVCTEWHWRRVIGMVRRGH